VTVNEQGESQFNDSQFAEVLPQVDYRNINGFFAEMLLVPNPSLRAEGEAIQ